MWQNLLFVSVEAPRSSPACDSVAQAPGFEGIRIFDVSNPRAPVLVKGVPTDCGSHTHTLVPDPRNRRVLLYVASYTAAPLAPSAYGNECKRWEDEAGTVPAHNKISVVEVPLRNPAEASVVSEPRFPQNVYRDGWTGCHDITVYMDIEKAASACMGEGQIWDISDLENPRTIARVHNPNVEFFHSATWSYDGRRVIFGDEAGGGTQARCRPQDADTLGALWFYDVRDLDVRNGTTVSPWRSSWKVPRDQVKLTPEQPLEPNCTMHNFNTLPTKKGDVLVSSAYAAGTTMVDFSDIYDPQEVGHLDPEGANTWSAYWYNGHIYTNDGGRGVDIIKVRDRATKGARTCGSPTPRPRCVEPRRHPPHHRDHRRRARNLDFYTRVLGLRLVAKTVNQDDPSVYHLFYADERGRPGAELTFFEYPGAIPGRAGAAWCTPSSRASARRPRSTSGRPPRRRGRRVERGDRLGALRRLRGARSRAPCAHRRRPPLTAEHPEIPPELALQGFEGVRAYSADGQGTASVMEGLLGASRRADGAWDVRGERREGWLALDPPPAEPGRQSAGTVHHIAWGTEDDDHAGWLQRLQASGTPNSGIIDRHYFRSLYFREPGGILFELATEGPGFTVDGPVEELGSRVILPPWLEPHRAEIEANLTPLPDPRAGWAPTSWSGLVRAEEPDVEEGARAPCPLTRSASATKSAVVALS